MLKGHHLLAQSLTHQKLMYHQVTDNKYRLPTGGTITNWNLRDEHNVLLVK